MSTVPVFVATDDNYLMQTYVCLQSILDHVAKENSYKIYVLSLIKDTSKIKIFNNLNRENFTIEFVKMEEMFSKAPELLDKNILSYLPPSTFSRVFIPDLFPNVDKAVYLDVDTIVNIDIAELFNINLEDNIIAGIHDWGVSLDVDFIDFISLTLGVPLEKYFNGGVLVLNSKKMREEGFFDLCMNVVKYIGRTFCADQDVLNVVCQDNTLLLNYEYNVATKCFLTPEKFKDYIGSIKEFKIIHYNTPDEWRPWNNEKCPLKEYFWNVAKKTPFYNELLP